jgi:type IV secretion system protein VirB11
MSEAIPLLAHAMRDMAPYLEDPGTEEFCVNQPGVGWWRKGGTWTPVALPGLDYLAMEGIAILAGALRGQDVGQQRPLLATELPGGERLQVCLPPAVPKGTISITLRKPGGEVAPLAIAGSRYQLENWNRWAERGTPAERAELLALFDAGDFIAFHAASVRARLNMLMGGATGSGKTSLAKTLLGEIDSSERILTIEDALELVVPQPNHVRLLYSQGGSGVTVRDLLVASMRMRPDRVMLQELREPAAAMTYVMEIMSGHPGSITTIHGGSPAEVARRLFALVKGAAEGAAMDDATLLSMIEGAVDLIVPFHNAGSVYSIRECWFRDDAARRGERLRDLVL